ncbi:hypothetical protein F994_02395 [Acinetobacter bohemicus ANC 3994]|uniref:Uncharacterized protein n=1 Tax=Acinetobacter bohemicus ANC 3994 TaxID=1217715 RepID=N8NZF3_9GAMM|nr:hypothetical protein [Acinetobacter bohemicus]ENU19535.1 hypothetical protein F994_02395 [Acinetobacter bohemicus ANC 3994]
MSLSPNLTAPVMAPSSPPAWGAVWVMSLCCAVLIASEFMPVSLLGRVLI